MEKKQGTVTIPGPQATTQRACPSAQASDRTLSAPLRGDEDPLWPGPNASSWGCCEPSQGDEDPNLKSQVNAGV